MEHAKLPLKMPETKNDEGPVTCLGMTFENDQERRAYFTEILRQKLPELKKNEGYPIGEDEDILALSDPPYYTACPNPFIKDFIKEWEREKIERYGKVDKEYHREPFVADVTEGKNDPIYYAHSYHTKVPHKAIMNFLSHYTDDGDIICDAFSGSGMTAVAAKLMNRNAIVSDLSPSATFIGYNYYRSIDVTKFKHAMYRILKEVEKECRWLYETLHTDGTTGKINYTVWSDVLICPQCLVEYTFWDTAVNGESGEIQKVYSCPNCDAEIDKDSSERATFTFFDNAINRQATQSKQVPVLINYSVGKKRYEKKPDEFDLDLNDKIDSLIIPYWFPVSRMPEGDESRRNDKVGITHVHHFYTKRTLYFLSTFVEQIKKQPHLSQFLSWFLTAGALVHTKMYAFRANRKGGIIKGTLYVSSLFQENNPMRFIRDKVNSYIRWGDSLNNESSIPVSSTQSALELSNIPNESIDYIFIDPPFGANLMYSELNFIWESWLKVTTNSNSEAVVSKSQGKSLNTYQDLMEGSFRECFRILKCGRWITVEFSNSRASVWNAIQAALERAGFVIANVSVLDKKQGSFKAVTTTTAVKQDLVISAYKPSTSMIEEIRTKENTAEAAWIFVRSHLEKLPVFVGVKGDAELIVERTPRVLFDRMVAYHVQNGYSVPISSAEFQEGVAQRFPMRDGMAFLETQVIEYDKKRLLAKEFVQTTLFVSDENSAIEWLRQQLMQKPQTRQDLHPNFMKELQHISKHELLPELDVLLEQNFLIYDGTGPVPSQIHAYLSTDFKDLRNLEKEDPKLQAKAKNRWYVPDPNKQADLEKLREKSLLREFNSYIEELGKSKKKLRQFRTEAIRAGFKTAWGNQDYQTIVDVGQRLPEKVLQEDSTMLMYYDNAQVRLGM